MYVGFRHIFIVLLLVLGAQASGVRACGWENFVLGYSCHGFVVLECGGSQKASCETVGMGALTEMGTDSRTDSPCLCSLADERAKLAKPVQSPLEIVCLPFVFFAEVREPIKTHKLSVRMNQRVVDLPPRCLPLLI